MQNFIKRSLAASERGDERFPTELSMETDGIPGLTKNVSATGIYFETQAAHEIGSRVHLTVEVNVRGEKLKLVCDGMVVRVDHKDGVLGIAAKLESSFFSAAADVIELNKNAPSTLDRVTSDQT